MCTVDITGYWSLAVHGTIIFSGTMCGKLLFEGISALRIVNEFTSGFAFISISKQKKVGR